MWFVSAKSLEETFQILTQIVRLISKVPGVEIKHQMGILTELREVVDIFEDQALVEPNYELVRKELDHVSSDVVSLQSTLLNLASDFDVVVSAHSVIKN